MSIYGYDGGDGEGGARSTGRIIGIAIGVVALLAVGFVVVRSRGDDGDDERQGVVLDDVSTTAVAAEGAAVSTEPLDTATVTTAAPTTVEAVTTTAEATTTTAKATTTTEPAPTTTRRSAPTTTRAPRATTTTDAPRAAGQPSYPTLPDGSPVPVLAIFDVDTITLSGTVPNRAAVRRLESLAIANSKTPAKLVTFLAINPDVPINVGVRVLELTSTRFPSGSAEVLPAHAAELDRIVTVMNALPHTTALVIGHADQRGDPAANFALSEERAQAVVRYVASKGIDASRLSSRAVGEADLISIADDEAALALNRRTEIVFYGLLIE